MAAIYNTSFCRELFVKIMLKEIAIALTNDSKYAIIH
jgi:hypothetical protein